MPASDNLWADYRETLISFRQLAEIRFKLLALLPALSGAAIGLMTFDLEKFRQSPGPRLLVGLLGFTVTLGIIFYDLRNSQLYNSLAFRARQIEEALDLLPKGQFKARPARTLRFLRVVTIWHDRGLALIYGSVLGAWVFPIVCGVLWTVRAQPWLPLPVPVVAGTLAVVAAIVVIIELHRLDRPTTTEPSDVEA